MKDQRDENRGVVEEEPVTALTVLTEALPMVARENGNPAGTGPRWKSAHQLPQSRVHVGDLAVVGASGAGPQKGAGRRVGIVRIVVVDPQKPGGMSRRD